jgi:hypothetical protein
MLSHLRRRIGVLSAIAVLAALVPALTVSPVSAAPATVAISTVAGLSAEATFLTCPDSASIPAAGFTDTTSTDVDCLAYYGITKGTTATTYDPTASVARWQMALYLTRAMTEAGVTLGTGADQGFTDISGKSAEIQTAINQLKQLGVTAGKTATTYAPDDNVLRQEMAMFIERTLDNVAPGPGGISHAERVSGLATTYINSNCGVAAGAACTGTYNYTDIDAGSITVEASDAVKELYSLNIHDGITATTFNPDADMTRAAMATFLVGALNHSNLRPEGIILQASAYTAIGTHTPTMSVTNRDASFDAIAGTAIDVFVYTPTGVEGNVSFGSTGLCSATAVTTGAITKCSIDVSEPVTDLSGNMVPTAKAAAALAPTLNVGGTDTYHAWSAAVGTAFDNDLHSSGTSYDTIVVAADPDAADINCTTDVPTYANSSGSHFTTMKFGAVTTITCQVTNQTDLDAYSNVAKAAHSVTMVRTRVCTTSTACTNGNTVDAESVTALTDATGALSFTITGPANPLLAGADKYVDTIILTSTNITAGNSPLTGIAGFAGLAGGVTTLTWGLEYLDTDAASDIASSTQTSTSSLAATASVTRSVSHTSHDQFGDIVAGEVVTFTSVSELPKNATAAVANPGVFTLVAHGLAVGDDVKITDLGAATAGGTTAAGTDQTDAWAINQTFVVGTVPSVDTFTLTNTASTPVGLQVTAVSAAADPTLIHATSFASATRTTNASGVATFSWADTEGTSGKDTVTSNGATGGSATAVHYRLATAADQSSTDANDVIAAGDLAMSLVEFDAVGKDFIVEVETNTAPEDPTKTYMQFTYDANDQFAITAAVGTLNGTAATEAVWVARMGLLCATACATGGVRNDVVYINGWTGLSTAIVRYSTD